MPAASLVTGYDPYFIRFADEAAMFHVEGENDLNDLGFRV
jgi:hypothetical protein